MPPSLHSQAEPSTGRDAEKRIFDQILNAISERRLPPGTKLTEDGLVELFGVSRARVRKVLLLLSEQRVVTLEPNRGAFVACPTLEEASDLFRARTVIEDGTLNLVASLPPGKLERAVARLDAHIALEAAAAGRGDVGAQIRLSGEFHVLLAEISGSAVMTEILNGLVRRTALALAAHGPRQETACASTDHPALVAALRARDRPRLLHLSAHHLGHLAASLVFPAVSRVSRMED